MKKPTGFLACSVAILFLASPCAQGAQRRGDLSDGDPGNASIRCRVLLPSGAPAGRGIKVTLNNRVAPINTLFSDKNGEVGFNYLSAGNYRLDVEANPQRYDPVSQTAVVYVSKESIVSVYLREKALREAKPAGNVATVGEFDAAVPPQAKKEYERASRLARKGDARGAIRGFERALEIYPDYQKARNDLGVQYFKAGRKREAAEQFETAIRLDPRSFNPRLNLGLLLVDTGEHARAIEQLELAIAIDDTQPAAHLHYGIALVETGELEGAKREFHTTLLLGRDAFAVAYYRLGVVHARLGERDEAMQALGEYLVRLPKGEFAPAARTLLDDLASGK